MKSFSDYGISVPHGAHGDVYTTCPECSPGRKKKSDTCLSVNVDKGVWVCHHCDWKGCLEYTDDEKREYAQSNSPTPPPRAPAPTAPPPPPPQTSNLTPEAIAWLESRGMSEGLGNAIGLKSLYVYFPKLSRKAAAVAIPFWRDGAVVNQKYRAIDGKAFSQQKGGQQCLFGWDEARGQNTVVLTEGEMDALALMECDIDGACSCPNGAPALGARDISGKLGFIDEARAEVFEPAERVILAMDHDEPGIRWRDAIAEHIGVEKCWTVKYPEDCKDCNDVLVKHSAEALRECIHRAQRVPVSGVGAFVDFTAQILDYYRSGGSARGLTTGWANIDKHFTLTPGSLNVLTGIPSSGKSEWLDQLMLNATVRHGWKWVVFSPENQPPAAHFQKIAEKVVQKPMFNQYSGEAMTEADVMEAIDLLSQCVKFITIDERGQSIDDILAKAKACVVRYGVNGFVLDPYNEVEHNRPASKTLGASTTLQRSSWRTRRNSRNAMMAAIQCRHRMTSAEAQTGATRPTTASRSGAATTRGTTPYRSTSRKCATKTPARSVW